jgi:glycosyltransferase involved in cell wall biosynthesis
VKIVHTLHAFPPESRAGSENYVEALALAQSERHDVSVFYRIADPALDEYVIDEAEHLGLRVFRLNRTFRDLASFAETYESPAVATAFGKFLDREKPDVVHFHHVTCLSTTCVHEAQRRGIRTVFTLHDFWLICPRGQRLRHDLTLCESHTQADCVRCVAAQLRVGGGHARSRALLERAARLREMRLPRAIYRRIASRPFAKESDAIAQIEARERAVRSMFDSVDLFVSPSHFLKERFVEEGLAADRILVSDNGFDMTSWRSFKRTPRGDGAPIRFAYLGTWIPSKGVHVLLEAFRELDPKRAVLEIHGYAVPFDGFESYPDQLMALAENAPHIRLGNRYEPGDVPQLLAEADALIIPSLWYENSPLTIHEAFLAGLPVIAAAHGGQQEFVKALGLDACFKPASVRSLRATLQRLINEPTRLDAMRERVPVVKEIRANAVELEALYPG